jgi:hypothetical protein
MRSKTRNRSAFRGQKMVSIKCPRCRKRLARAWTFASAAPGGLTLDFVLAPDVQVERRDQLVFSRPVRWQCPHCNWSSTDERLAQLVHWAERAGQGEVTFGQPIPPPEPSRDW